MRKHEPTPIWVYNGDNVNISVRPDTKREMFDVKYYSQMNYVSAFRFCSLLDMAIEQYPEIKHIGITICSYGGAVDAVIVIINKLTMYKMMGYTVSTIIVGGAYSAGAILSIAGASPNRRYMAPSAIIMIHQGTMGAFGTTADIRVSSKLVDLFLNIMKKFLIESGIKQSYADEVMAHSDWYYSAQQALDYELIDKVSKYIPKL